MAGSTFTVNPTRLDPYKNYRFRVKIDDVYVLGCNKVSPLRRTTQVIETRSGGESGSPHKTPGRTSYDAIVIEAGLTHDPTFEQWANKVWSHAQSTQSTHPDVSLKDFRKNIRIEVYNEGGQLVMAYNVFRCWPSEYQALPELDADSSAVAITMIKLENEGWERDAGVTEPLEQSFTLPSAT